MSRRHCESCQRWKRPAEFLQNAATLIVRVVCITCRPPGQNVWPLVTLPADPLQDLILRRESIAEAARELRVDERRVARFMRQDRVQVSTADEWCIRLGHTLEEVYI